MRELFTAYPTQLLGGGLLVLLGILVRFFPNLIAGYNTMSAEQKKNVDVKGLSRFMCLSLAAILRSGLRFSGKKFPSVIFHPKKRSGIAVRVGETFRDLASEATYDA